VAEELLSLTSPGDPERAMWLENLRFWLGERSLLDPDRDDIDRATELAEEALSRPPKDDAERRDGSTTWTGA
jgi:hypothetical protein